MAWTTLTEAALLAVVNDAELTQARQTAQQPGQADPVETVLSQVTALVRGYVRRRYDLEASGIPPSLEAPALDIVAYRIASRISSKLAEGRKAAHDAAIRLLEAIAEGKFGVEDATEISESSNVTGPRFNDRTLSHTRDHQDGI